MSTLRPQPDRFDNYSQLDIWTTYGDLMLKLHESFNGLGCPFTESSVWTYINDKATPYTFAEILASVRLSEKRTIRVKDVQKNSYFLDALVASVTVVTSTTLILVFEGELSRSYGGQVLETTVKVVCCYNLDDGRGFCLLPELARAQLYSR